MKQFNAQFYPQNNLVSNEATTPFSSFYPSSSSSPMK
jgi:hypothetical protein